MDTIQTNNHCSQDLILKSNLWKFFKTLRVQANPIYYLLVASPVHYAWITISDKSDPTSQKRISVSQFINSLKKLPTTDKSYRLGICLYDPAAPEHLRRQTFEAAYRHELSVETILKYLYNIITFHCWEALKKCERLEITPQTIAHYKFKARYVEQMKAIFEQCNTALTNEIKTN